MRTLARGSRGDDVRDVQSRLAALEHHTDPDEPGRFGPATERAVRAFQQDRHLMVDGLVGLETWEEMIEAGFTLGDRVLYLRYPFIRGDDVRALQHRLNLLGFDPGREDGIFGDRTDRAVRDFQRNVGMTEDGIVGPGTHQAVVRLRPVGPGPGRGTVREQEALRRLSATVRGARIGIDAGHGAEDMGALGPSGSTEAGITWTLASGLARRLEARGAAPSLLRDEAGNPTVHQRAARANDLGVEILISIHLNWHDDPRADGASTYFYGSGQWVSHWGQRLAEMIQDGLTAGVGFRDCRVHPKALQILRETRMPAVQVEAGYITNPREEALLLDPAFQERLVDALADAVDRFLTQGSGTNGARGHHAEDRSQQTPEAQPVEGSEDLRPANR